MCIAMFAVSSMCSEDQLFSTFSYETFLWNFWNFFFLALNNFYFKWSQLWTMPSAQFNTVVTVCWHSGSTTRNKWSNLNTSTSCAWYCLQAPSNKIIMKKTKGNFIYCSCFCLDFCCRARLNGVNSTAKPKTAKISMRTRMNILNSVYLTARPTLQTHTPSQS
jgi:hypothetical protein